MKLLRFFTMQTSQIQTLPRSRRHVLDALALVAITTLVPSLQAQVVFDGTASQFEAYYSDDFFGTSSTNTFTVQNAGTFSTDFGVLGDVVFSVTWRAPIGERFVFTAPTGFNSTDISFIFNGGSQGGGGGTFSTSSPTITFNDLSGSLSSPNANMTLADPSFNNPVFNASYSGQLAGGASISFSSLTLSTLVPGNYNKAFPGSSISFRISGYASAFAPTPDPGAWMTTIAIPEPSAFGLFAALSGLVTAGLRRPHRTATRPVA